MPISQISQCVVFSFGLSMAVSVSQLHAEDMPAQVQVGEHRLVLNGHGARSEFFVQLYTAGLYLQQPKQDAAAIAAADEPMALRIKITSGFVSQSKLVDSLNEGFQKATRGNTATIQNEIQKFRACFSEDIQKGDVFDLVYHPKLGLLVNKNGRSKGAIQGLEFKRALFNIWLCDQPADASLKQALLQGGKLR